VAFAWPGVLRAQGPAPVTGRVAYIDVGKIFGEYQRYKDIQEELKSLEQKLQTENEQRRQQADALQATVEAMDRADPNFVKKMADALQAKIDHKSWFEVKQAHTAREIALATDRIYRDILKATEEAAKQAGYDLVVYQDEYQPASMDPQELQNQMRTRRVIYANPTVNITQTVLDKLNVDYRAKPHTPELFVP